MSELNICFGDVFLYSLDSSRKYVIIDVGAKTWFFVSEVIEAENRLGIAGTSSYEDIGSIVSKLSLDEIIAMTERTIGSESPSIRKELRINAKKPSRILEK